MSISQTINLKPRRSNLKLDQIIISHNYKYAGKNSSYHSPSQLICSEWAKVSYVNLSYECRITDLMHSIGLWIWHLHPDPHSVPYGMQPVLMISLAHR
jgi:hypothetical protein